MEISSYEKQILLYGRHCRDPAGCGVWGADGVDVDYELGESLYVTFGGGWMGQIFVRVASLFCTGDMCDFIPNFVFSTRR